MSLWWYLDTLPIPADTYRGGSNRVFEDARKQVREINYGGRRSCDADMPYQRDTDGVRIEESGEALIRSVITRVFSGGS